MNKLQTKRVTKGIIIEIDPSFIYGLRIVISDYCVAYEGNLDAEKEVRDSPYITGEIPLSSTDYIELTKDLKIPTTFPKGMSGLDGETYTVSIVDGKSKVTFTWWVHCPEGWESLNIFLHKVIDFIRQKHLSTA